MPALCDVNLLLAFCYDRHVHHPLALAWLDAQDEKTVLLCRTTQVSLLRLLCTATIMGADLCTLVKAWEIYDAILRDDRFRFHAEPDAIEVALRRFTQTLQISPKLWQDAYLAAFAVTTGLQLASFDRGFRQFAGLELALLGV